MIFSKIRHIVLAALYNKTAINVDDLHQLLNEDFSQAFSLAKHSIFFYRADKNVVNNAAVIKPNIRLSADTSNVYNRLISDVLPSWRSYPKRNHSIIFTNNISDARRYSSMRKAPLYYIFPKNNAKIVISNTSDVWDAFKYKNVSFSLDIFNDDIIDFIDNLNDATNDNFGFKNKSIEDLFSDGSTKDLIDLFSQIDNIPLNIIENSAAGTTYLSKTLVDAMKSYNLTFTQALDYIMSPELNGFRLKSLNDIDNGDMLITSEMWTESDCLFIEKDTFESLLTNRKISGSIISPSAEIANQIMHTNCKNVYNQYRNNGLELYRVVESTEEFLINLPKQRTSAQTNNIYTMLFSHILRPWIKFPKRDNCVIFTNNPGNALTYMNDDDYSIYHAMPYNDSSIVVCPTRDMWASFDDTLNQFDLTDLDEFNQSFADFLTKSLNLIMSNQDAINKWFDDIPDSVKKLNHDKENIINLFNDVNNVQVIDDIFNCIYAFKDDIIIPSINNYDLLGKYIIEKMSKNQRITDTLEILFNPFVHGFSVIKETELYKYMDKQREFYTDNNVLLIKHDIKLK